MMNRFNQAHQSARNDASGFTLVEVMVALLIVVVAISSLLTQVMTTVDSTAQLRDKAIANWVALNQLELLYIANENPASSAYNTLPNKEVTGKEEMAGREWFWRIKPLQGTAAGSVPLLVSVMRTQDDDAALVSLVGVVDVYHKPTAVSKRQVLPGNAGKVP